MEGIFLVLELTQTKQKKFLGAAWVLRNNMGESLLHSRRAFGNIGSFVEAKFTTWMWAIESVRTHHVDKVIFEAEFSDLLGAVKRQRDWPALRYQGSKLRKSLGDLRGWSFRVIDSRTNRCAGAIAKSVVTQERWSQSYVAQGNPAWLKELFEADKQGL
ncbi:hypothetical protein Bca4012_072360 [Brassica carinata]